MARLLALALTALVASLAMAACGSSGGGGSDEDEIRTVVEHLRDSDEAICGELSDQFLKKTFKDKATCEKQAKASNEKNAFEIKSTKVDGDKASVQIASKNEKGTIELVKEGGDWKIDGLKRSTSSSSSGSDTNTSTQSASSDEVKARAAGDAFLQAVAKEDEQVVCGLLSESYAKKILNRPNAEFAIADCLQAFKKFNWAKLKKQGQGVTTKNVAVSGDSATVTLSDGETVNLKREGDRFVIENIH